MPVASLGQVQISYEDDGLADDPPLVLIPGLGTQLIFFEDEFVQGLMDRAFRVIRIDNRDAGLSSTFDEHPVIISELVSALQGGGTFQAPYDLGAMAGDIVALLDQLAIDKAHLLGMSLGGMIAQTIAIEHPERVSSLTLVSSTTGADDVGQPTPEAAEALLAPSPVGGRDAVVEANMETRRVWSTTEHFDADWTREYFARAYDRSHTPAGTSRQLAAVLTAGNREPELRSLTVPTLVMHGTDDKLISPSGGARLADVIAGATLVELDGMGHDLPPHYWAPIIEAVTQLAIRALR